MKLTTVLTTLLATATTANSLATPNEVDDLQARNASNTLAALDTCGDGYAADQRRTNSKCKADNGDSLFCSCDRKSVVMCIPSGHWSVWNHCFHSQCHGNWNGGAHC
ncbi:hypothetical protein BDW74DRAFT_183292 [Aspergillus multicolor]|uniref:uncharacterized protein n=1 Tax=Aspergillus multicolor TaxID=41759 RepID=UPI003CCE2054